MGAIFTQSRTPSEFGSKGCEAKGGFRRKSRTAREEQLRVRHHVHNFLKLTIVPPQWPPLLRLWPRKPLRLRAPLSQRRISEQGWCHYIRFISDSFLPHYPTLTYTTFYTYSPSRLAGLKTVTKDMQTWRAEYKGGDAPAPAVATKAKVAPRVQETVKGPPKLEFQEDICKWLVEWPAKKRRWLHTLTVMMIL